MDNKENAKLAREKAKEAHEYLKNFIGTFDKVHRGGLHDMIETLIAAMVQGALDKVDKYVKDSNSTGNASWGGVMTVMFDSFQGVLDDTKRGIEAMQESESK